MRSLQSDSTSDSAADWLCLESCWVCVEFRSTAGMEHERARHVDAILRILTSFFEREDCVPFASQFSALQALQFHQGNADVYWETEEAANQLKRAFDECICEEEKGITARHWIGRPELPRMLMPLRESDATKASDLKCDPRFGSAASSHSRSKDALDSKVSKATLDLKFAPCLASR